MLPKRVTPVDESALSVKGEDERIMKTMLWDVTIVRSYVVHRFVLMG